ncbi:multiple epidermal growth factor-like domains protein 10, partial [Saccostrea cucullata]|uniref:multiple epidermal growth factor-like domains protein 10 n=1 Tax=Saccostrea cuccullata TaxID=36930 RepID=UPI002ED2E245
MTTNCAKECEDGNFGPGCIHKCSGNCRDKSQCNKATGVCDFGCNPGYTEPFCNTTCADGKFGIQCKEACSGHCLNHSKCNHIEGSCNKGCENGYTGDRCNNPCEDGLFGVNCSQKCSLNCQQSQKCNNRDGSCPCSSGWTGQHCNKECDAGFYGENCVQACSSHCRNMTCAKDNGKCLDGCEPSYYGVKCDQEGDTCTVVSYAKEYHIMGSILGVYTVITCVIFALCILRRHRKTKEIVSKQIEEKDKEKSYETMQIDRVLYQELGSFENK